MGLAEEAAECSLQSLNDDCLLEIFSYLEPDDLLHMYEVDSRFKYFIRDRVIPIRLFDFLNISENWNTTKIFQRFGQKLRRIKIGPYATNSSFDYFLELITRYCKPETLVELHLHHYNDQNESELGLMTRALPFFSKLEKLKFVTGAHTSASISTKFLKQLCLAPTFNLKVLTLFQAKLDEEWLHSETLHNLEELRVHSCSSLGIKNNQNLIDFLQTKPKLKLFSYMGECYYSPEINAAIASCTRLETLSYIDNFTSSKSSAGIKLKPICYLPALKHLAITSYGFEGSDIHTWLRQYSGKNELETLTITHNTRDIPLPDSELFEKWKESYMQSATAYLRWVSSIRNTFLKLTTVNIFVMQPANHAAYPPSLEFIYKFLSQLPNLKSVTIRTNLYLPDWGTILNYAPQIDTLSLQLGKPSCFGIDKFVKVLKNVARERPIHLIIDKLVREQLQVNEKETLNRFNQLFS